MNPVMARLYELLARLVDPAVRREAERREALRAVRPDSAERVAHALRVETALGRSRALYDLEWGSPVDTGDVASLMSSMRVEHPGFEFVRLGGDGDGGYVVPDDLEGVVACFSPGVADRADFEAELVNRGIPCHLLDASVSEPPIKDELVTFTKAFLGPEWEPGWTTLDTWVSEAAPENGDLLLQMDIEGWEWEVLATCSREVLRRFRLVVIELHDLHLLATPFGLRRMRHVLRRLQEEFALVHLHPNNYEFPVEYQGIQLHPVIEATWLRRDRMLAGIGPSSTELDRHNGPDLPDFPLDPRWGSISQ